MTKLWVPPKISRELEAERRREHAEVNKLSALGNVVGVMKQFNYELQQIDQYLSLEYLPEGVDTGTTSMKAGYYHVVRRDPSAPPSVMVVEDENGMPMEPTSRLFDQLRAADFWNPAVVRDREKCKRLAEEARNRQMAREDEDRRQELIERTLAVTRTQVSMAGENWTQNNSPAARRERAEAKKKRQAQKQARKKQRG